MTIEVSKWEDSATWCVEIDGRIVSYGLRADEAEQLAADWRETPWVSSWRFAPAG